MISAKFYKFTGRSDTVNKQLGDGTEILGFLRDDFNVLNPEMTVRRTNGLNFNMAYIPNFMRYYHIDKIIQIDSDRYHVMMSVDVLKTYESEIMAAAGTVTESDNPNPYISNRNTVFNRKPKLSRLDFEHPDLFNSDGQMIMVTIKGNI